jgi:signal transduction histidine kinase
VDKIHADDRPKFLAAIAGLTPEIPTGEVTYRARASDGTLVWLKSNGRAFFDADGKMLRVIGMVADITDLKRAEEALTGFTKKLIEAHEQERTRIARELHDDINQRIALLAVKLSALKRDLPDAANAARQGIEQTEQQLTELGSDIQALSHHLHSSKLEYLGLAAAAKGFCREFSERHKVDVHFHSDELPKVLSPEISLCLFRVLQEALQNAMKHSGSACFDVSLGKGLNEIQLSVRDSGRGFDVDEAMNGRGVGLVSMKERLKLVDGQLFIDSKMQQGTTIRASVPLSPRMKSAGAVG